MKPKTSLRHFLALAGSSLLAFSYSHAATVNWQGDTSNLWATAGNWDAAPANSLLTDIVNFNLATYGGNPVWAPTVGTATSINGITIGASNGTMTLTNTAALSIGASGISIANGAGAFTISGSTTLGASQSWTNNSASLFTFGAVTNGANLLTIGGSGNTTASGIIGNGAGGLTKEGAGLLTLNAANTYTGATTVNGGELRWGVANAIAGGALNINNGGTVNIQTFNDTVGTVTLAQGGSITGTTGVLTTGSFISNNGGTMTGATLLLSNNGSVTYNSTGSGSTTLQIDKLSINDSGTNVFDIADGDAAVDFDITGFVNNGGNNVGRTITKTGAGAMQFSGSTLGGAGQNSISLNISEGTVLMNRATGVAFVPGGNGLITVGDGNGSAGTSILKFANTGGNEQLGSRPITINSDGLFDLNGKTETMGALTANSTGQLQLNNGSLTVTTLALNPSAGNTTSLSLGASGTLTLGGDVTFNAAGTGQAQITGSALSLGAASRIFTVGPGAGAGGDLLIDAQISASGARSLTKAGAGRLTLSNTNSYTGGTTVSAGTLLLSGAFNMPGTGTLTVSNGGTFSLADGTARATTGATTGSGLNLAAGSSLAFDWNGSSLDSFTTTGTATTAAGVVAIHINNTSPTGSGGTLISAASGLGTATYLLANNTNYTATISKTATTVSIGAQSSATALTDAYWLGGQVTGALGAMALSNGTTSNWASDAAGSSAAGVVPGGSAVNVIFGATGAAQQASVTTGAHMNLGSITFNDSAAVTIGGGNTITLNSTSSAAATTSGALATVTAGSAISVTQYSSTTTNTNTINANLLLGANQTWNVASGKTLVVSGQVAGGFGLTKADAGTVTLTGASTYSGTTTISAGILQIGNNTTTGSLSTSSAIVNNASLVFNRSNAVTQGTDFAAGISGTGSVTQAGSSTLTLTGTNTYQGGTFVNAGTLAITADANLGNSSGDLTFTGNSTLNMNATGFSMGAGRTITVNPGVTATFTSNNDGKTFQGSLEGSGTLFVNHSTSFIFNNASNFTGSFRAATANSSGYGLDLYTLRDEAGDGTISLENGSFRWFGSGGTKTFDDRQFFLGGNGSIYNRSTDNSALFISKNLGQSGSGTRTLTLGGTTAGGTFAGNIGDNGASAVSLLKVEAGTWVLSGSNSYTGATDVREGTLVVKKMADYGANSSIGAAASGPGIILGNGSIMGSLVYEGTGDSTNRFLRIGGQATILNNGTGALNFTANTFEVTGASTTTGITLGGSNGGSISGAIPDKSAPSQITAITKTGTGSWTLGGTNTYTGATTLNGGRLVLDYAASNTTKLANGAALTLGGGDLELSGGSHTEVVASTTLTNNTGTRITQTNSGSSVLQLGTISRSNGGSTLSFSADNIATTNNTNTNGILGPGYTVGSHWAVNSTNGANGAIVALSTYTTTVPTTGGVNTANYQLTGDQTQTGNLAANTLRIVNGAADDELSLGTHQLNLTSTNGVMGAFIYAGGFNDNYTISGTTGIIKAATGNNHLGVNVHTGTLTVNALFNTGSATTTKWGAGTLVVGSNNSALTGAHFVQEGTLRLANNGATGSTAGGIVVSNGAALELSNSVAIGAEALAISGHGISNAGALRNVASNTSSYAGAITIGTGGARINSDSGGSLTLTGGVATSLYNNVTFGGAGNTTVSTAAISGSGNVIKDGAGALTLSAANTYTGGTSVTGGTLLVNTTTGSGTGTGAVTVASGATLGGSGIISGNVTTQNGGTLAAGTSIESLATGSLTQEAGSTFAYEADNDAAAGVAGDLTAVTGNLTFDLTNAAILTLTELGSGSWAAAEKLTLISYTGAWNGGLFKYLGNDVADDSSIVFSGYNWTFNYNDTAAGTNFTSDLTGGGFVTMTAVSAIPEPSAALLGGLGLLLLLRRRR